MLLSIIQLKFCIWTRTLKELPLFHILVNMALLAVFIFLMPDVCRRFPYNIYVLGCVFIIILTIHETRKDYHFCKMMLKNPSALFFLEYSIITVPFAVLFLINKQFLYGGLCLFLPIVISIVPRVSFHFVQDAKPLFIPMPSLEATSFFRKYRAAIWVVLLSAFGLCFEPVISMLLLYILILFYASMSFSQAESLTVLSFDELPPKRFLGRKIYKEIKFWIILSAPVLILYAIFNMGYILYVLAPLILGPFYISFCISAKYMQYRPNTDIDGTVFQAICMVGYIIPVLLPLSLVMTFISYYQATDNLKTYLDAYNQ